MWMAGCATAPPGAPLAELSGRILIKVDASADTTAQSHTASFEISGNERAGTMRLTGPLGAQVALASWNASGASLEDSQGTRQFADLAALAEQTLGEPLPLGALLYWLRGQPWPGAAHRAGPSGFLQLGWSIDLQRFAADALIEATRIDPPGLSVRAKLDRGA